MRFDRALSQFHRVDAKKDAQDGGKLPWRGQQDQEILQVKLINLYDLTHWVIKPLSFTDFSNASG